MHGKGRTSLMRKSGRGSVELGKRKGGSGANKPSRAGTRLPIEKPRVTEALCFYPVNG